MQRVAWRKLAMLDAAEALTDLFIPPGNRLEKPTGNRAGQHSIRINQQRRICFTWSDAGSDDVEIVGYHQGEASRRGYGHAAGAPGGDPAGGVSSHRWA